MRKKFASLLLLVVVLSGSSVFAAEDGRAGARMRVSAVGREPAAMVNRRMVVATTPFVVSSNEECGKRVA